MPRESSNPISRLERIFYIFCCYILKIRLIFVWTRVIIVAKCAIVLLVNNIIKIINCKVNPFFDS